MTASALRRFDFDIVRKDHVRDAPLRRLYAAATVGLIATIATIAHADGAWTASRTRPLFYPEGPEPLRWRLAAGALIDILPSRVVESEVRQIPQVTITGRLGLPSGFAAHLRLRGNGVGNEGSLGFGYAHAIGPIWVSVADHQGVWFGYLGIDNAFSTFGWGFTNTPSVTVGVPWNGIRFSVLGEAFFSFAQHTTLGDSSKTSRQGFFLSGFSATLLIENMLDAGGIVYFGIGALQTQPNYQAWVAFSDERTRFTYPRLVGGYAF